MKPHPALRDELMARLQREVGAAESEPQSGLHTPPPPYEGSGIKALVKRYIRKATAWYVEPAAQRAASEWAGRVHELLSAEMAELSRRVDPFGHDESVAINLELMKAEFRSLLKTVEELGLAIAPGAGLEAASQRIAELREKINAVERKTRAVGGELSPRPPTSGAPSSGVASAAIDYAALERRFRGSSETISAIQKDRYLEILRDHAPVVDLGCGKGELLQILRESGIDASGVDLDAGMVSEARAKGLDAHEGDALAFLGSRSASSIGSMICLHVVEHLELDVLVRLLEVAVTRLKPGGLFIAETPNPATLIVLGNSFVLDPTHVRPIHPSLMTFLCESAGFRDVRLQFYSPATDYQLPLIPDAQDQPWIADVNRAFERLNNVLFGPQEYAVIATTPTG